MSQANSRFKGERKYLAVVSAFLVNALGFAIPSRAQNFDAMGQLVVHVRTAGHEAALAQARVELVKFPSGVIAEQFTGSDGNVSFSAIPVGAYTVRVTRQGYQMGQASVDFRRGDATLQNVDMLLLPQEKDGKNDSADSTVSADELKIPERARKEFERGRRLLNDEKNAKESIAAFQNALSAYANYYDAYVLLGTAQMQIGMVSPAEETLRKAIALDDRKTGAFYPLAMTLFTQKKYSEEQKILKQAQTLEPSDWRWKFELARADAQQGNWDQALQEALEVKKLPNAPAKIHLLLGDIYSNTGRLKESIDELELFVHLDPQSPFVARIQQVLPELRKKLAATAQQ